MNHTCLYVGHDWFTFPYEITTTMEDGLSFTQSQIITHCRRCHETTQVIYKKVYKDGVEVFHGDIV